MANIGIRDGVISSSAQVEIQVPELRIKGDLIAENYIVSSSVSNIEYQSLSGSTIFGDSADDTHQFTGSISATGSLTVNGGGGGHPLTLQTDTGDKGISLLNYQGTEIFQLRQEAGDAGLLMLKDGGNTKVLFTARPSNHSYINVSGGNFGIGIDSPDRLLHLRAASPSIMWEDTDVSGLKHQIIAGGNAGLEVSVDINNTATGYFRVDVGGTEKMRLLESGNLGIGNTSPPHPLTVQGDISGSGRITIGSHIFTAGNVYLDNEQVLNSADSATTLTLGGDSAWTQVNYGNDTDVVHNFRGTMISGSATSTGSFGSLVVIGNQTIAAQQHMKVI